MKITSRKLWVDPGLRSFIVIVLIFGLLFRLIGLEQKIYSFDETYTSLRSSGRTETELRLELKNGRIFSTEDLQKYQRINSGKKWSDTLFSLAKEEPQFPPLYFMMVRGWALLFSDSVKSIRTLSVLFSLIAFPAIYWFCRELFYATQPIQRALTSWFAVALLAISPFHFLYAQEARPYSLWTVLILASSAALLRAMRLRTTATWLLYGVLLCLSFYTYLYSILVAISHTIYIIVVERCRWTKTFKSYTQFLVAGISVVATWGVLVLTNDASTAHVSGFFNNSATRVHLVNRWVSNFTRVFLDFGYYRNSIKELILVSPLILGVLGLVGYALYYLWRNTPKQVWLLPLSLITVQIVIQMIPDFLLGQWRFSGETRYLVPSYIAIQVAVAFLFSAKLSQAQPRKIWAWLLLLVMCAGILSAPLSANARAWWHKGPALEDLAVAKIANEGNSSLIVSYSSFPNSLIVLSYLVDPKVKFMLPNSPQPQIPFSEFSHVFLWGASEAEVAALQQSPSFSLEPIVIAQKSTLWQIKPRS
jgi:uncharacterized membrane protein